MHKNAISLTGKYLIMFDKLKKKERFLDIWKRRHFREQLTSEERRIAGAMEEHTEYHALWSTGDVYQMLNYRGEADPFFHILIHALIEEQLEKNDPPEVGEILKNLAVRGKDRHMVLHGIGLILADEMFDMLKYNRPFNKESYVDRLKGFRPSESA